MQDKYISLAAGILLQAKRDLDAFPKTNNMFCEYDKILDDIESFLESDWCQTLCQLADVDHRMYTRHMGELLHFQREGLENKKRKGD